RVPAPRAAPAARWPDVRGRPGPASPDSAPPSAAGPPHRPAPGPGAAPPIAPGRRGRSAQDPDRRRREGPGCQRDPDSRRESRTDPAASGLSGRPPPRYACPVTKHIGIAAVSPEGAAILYRNIYRQASHLLEPHPHPRLSLHNEPLAHYIDAVQANDWHAVGNLLRRSAEVLARCGAEICLCPDNAVQHGIHLAEAGSPIPWLT